MGLTVKVCSVVSPDILERVLAAIFSMSGTWRIYKSKSWSSRQPIQATYPMLYSVMVCQNLMVNEDDSMVSPFTNGLNQHKNSIFVIELRDSKVLIALPPNLMTCIVSPCFWNRMQAVPMDRRRSKSLFKAGLLQHKISRHISLQYFQAFGVCLPPVPFFMFFH